jgi:hypothetical protein
LQSSAASSLDERVVEVERLLETYLYPPQTGASADARKTLAFESQDRFLGSSGKKLKVISRLVE